MTAKKKSKKSVKPELAPSDPTAPTFSFETPKWKQEFAGILLTYARAVRTGNLKAVELFANLQATINVISEQLGGMTALEDGESKPTVVLISQKAISYVP